MLGWWPRKVCSASDTHPRSALIRSYEWLDPDMLLACLVPLGAERPPLPEVAPGPRVQDNSNGAFAQVRTERMTGMPKVTINVCIPALPDAGSGSAGHS